MPIDRNAFAQARCGEILILHILQLQSFESRTQDRSSQAKKQTGHVARILPQGSHFNPVPVFRPAGKAAHEPLHAVGIKLHYTW